MGGIGGILPWRKFCRWSGGKTSTRRKPCIPLRTGLVQGGTGLSISECGLRILEFDLFNPQSAFSDPHFGRMG